MAGIALCQVDAFADVPFAGNPAAAAPLDESRPDYWLQAVDSEMNLSETTYRQRRQDRHGLSGVTAAANEPDTDFVSRVFGPRVGIAEDPVTGSSHCILAPWWGTRLGLTEMRAHQISARGGRLVMRLKGSGDDARVELEGKAATVMDATLHT